MIGLSNENNWKGTLHDYVTTFRSDLRKRKETKMK